MNDRVVDPQVLSPHQRSRYYGITSLPDETTYSFVARAALLTGAGSFSQVAIDLFGNMYASNLNAARFHGGFGKLASHFVGLDEGDLESLQSSLSYLPFLQPFVTPADFSNAKALSCSSVPLRWWRARIVGVPGLFHSHSTMCRECVLADSAKYYIGYYHRVHQISAVTVCPIHGNKLLMRCPGCNRELSRIPSITCHGCGCDLLLPDTSNNVTYKAHLRLARFALAALSGNMPIVDSSLRLAVLRTRAREALGSNNNTVGVGVARHLVKAFGREYLRALGYPTDSFETIGWPSLVINEKAWSASAVSQLLLISAFFDSVDDFRRACERQARLRVQAQAQAQGSNGGTPRRWEVPWSSKVILHLVRFGDIKKAAKCFALSEEQLIERIDSYPLLRARIRALGDQHSEIGPNWE